MHLRFPSFAHHFHCINVKSGPKSNGRKSGGPSQKYENFHVWRKCGSNWKYWEKMRKEDDCQLASKFVRYYTTWDSSWKPDDRIIQFHLFFNKYFNVPTKMPNMYTEAARVIFQLSLHTKLNWKMKEIIRKGFWEWNSKKWN